MKSIIYLLCGLPGSGKSTYAKRLEKEGVVRLTLDEELFARFGREFPSEKYNEYENETKNQLKGILQSKIQTGESVVLDYGFWKKASRDEYKEFVTQIGGEWKLLYFKVPVENLKERLKARNAGDQINNHLISQDLLDRLFRKATPYGFEPYFRCLNTG